MEPSSVREEYGLACGACECRGGSVYDRSVFRVLSAERHVVAQGRGTQLLGCIP